MKVLQLDWMAMVVGTQIFDRLRQPQHLKMAILPLWDSLTGKWLLGDSVLASLL